jgi:hypothetical protein
MHAERFVPWLSIAACAAAVVVVTGLAGGPADEMVECAGEIEHVTASSAAFHPVYCSADVRPVAIDYRRELAVGVHDHSAVWVVGVLQRDRLAAISVAKLPAKYGDSKCGDSELPHESFR